MTTQDRRFKVALSFPGERRDFVSQVADHLAQQLGQVRVFYDSWYAPELARPDLDVYLGQIYHNDSELVVPFYCAEYDPKKWCGLEWRQMRDLLFNFEGHRIMPFRFDNAPISCVLSIDGYIEIGNRTPEAVAGLILQRLSGSYTSTAVDPRTGADFLLTNTRKPPEATNPATLLNARYEVAPFFDEARAAELAALKEWCACEGPATSVRLFHGPGGTGKTRLFIEWAKQLRKEGWDAGFLPEKVDVDQIESILHAGKPTLVVLDYAECRAGLFEFLKRIAERPDEHRQRLRIVLLARSVADWWQSLLQRDETVRHLLAQTEPTLIAPVEIEGPLRKHIWEHARNAFEQRLQKAAPLAPVDLKDDRFGRILYLHMSALMAVQGIATRPESLLDEIVIHEKHFWARRYQEEFGRDDFEAMDFDKRCSRLVAAVTLQDGMSSREAAEELNRRIEGPAERYQHFVPLLRSLYPGLEQKSHARYLGPVEPDLLGAVVVKSNETVPFWN